MTNLTCPYKDAIKLCEERRKLENNYNRLFLLNFKEFWEGYDRDGKLPTGVMIQNYSIYLREIVSKYLKLVQIPNKRERLKVSI